MHSCKVSSFNSKTVGGLNANEFELGVGELDVLKLSNLVEVVVNLG